MSSDRSRGISSAAGANKRPLALALGLTVTYMLAEVIGGVLTGSLALLADAAHMLTDAAGIGFALFAIRLAETAPTSVRTYGMLRAEILSALGNAIVLLLLTAYILYEAYRRFLEPPEILGLPMLAVAVVGLFVNFASMRLLSGGSDESLNVRGAYFEVLADMLGSVGVIIAALIVTVTGWRLADPIIGAGIGLFIVPRTWNLLREATAILIEGAPAHIDVSKLAGALGDIPGVTKVHHLHVWTITSGFDAMSTHLVATPKADERAILATAEETAKRFKLAHTTIQIETISKSEPELKV